MEFKELLDKLNSYLKQNNYDFEFDPDYDSLICNYEIVVGSKTIGIQVEHMSNDSEDGYIQVFLTDSNHELLTSPYNNFGELIEELTEGLIACRNYLKCYLRVQALVNEIKSTIDEYNIGIDSDNIQLTADMILNGNF